MKPNLYTDKNKVTYKSYTLQIIDGFIMLKK